MKKYFKLIIGAILLGALFAYLFYKDINKEVIALEKEKDNIYLFQVGVFKNLDNANNYAKQMASKIIYQTDDFYRVIVCLTTDDDNKEKLINYYKENNLNYYIKQINNQTIFNKINKYEELLKKSTKEKAINEVCQNMLNIFLTYS